LVGAGVAQPPRHVGLTGCPQCIGVRRAAIEGVLDGVDQIGVLRVEDRRAYMRETSVGIHSAVVEETNRMV
jgi:hypothetical protein